MGASIGTLTATIDARTDPFEKGLQKGGRSLRGFAADAETASNAAARNFDKMGRGFGTSMGELAKGARMGVAGLALLSDAGSQVSGQFGQLAGSILTGFGAGGPLGAAIGGGASLFHLLASSISSAKDQAEKLAQVEATRALKARTDAAERAKHQAEYTRGLMDELELLNAGSDAERAKILRGRTLSTAREKGGINSEMTQKAILDREREIEQAKAVADAQAKARADVAAYNEAKAAGFAAESKAYGDRRAAMADEAREFTRRAALNAEALKHDGERQKIAELRKAGLANEANAMQAALDLVIQRERAEANVNAKIREREEATRRLDELNRAMARDAEEEAAKRRADGAIQMQLMLNSTDYATKKSWGEKPPVERLDSRDPTGGWTPGAGMGPLAMAREAKKQAAQNERWKRHADNLRAESRERMGLVDAGWSAPGADVQPRKRVKFTGPAGVVRNDDGTVWEPGQDDPSRIRGRFGVGGSGRDGERPGPPTISPSGENTPYVDGRMGEAAARLSDAQGQIREETTKVADKLDETTTAAQQTADGLTAAATAGAGLLTVMQSQVEAMAQIATVVADMKKVQDQMLTTMTQAAQIAGP